jgi:uncharacterized protein (TIGR02444 family)
MTAAHPHPHSHAWDWAVAVYARPGVEDALLDLQDRFGQCVPLLLTAAWAAAEGRVFDAESLEAAADAARVYEGTIVGPLRAIRRTLKAPVPDLDDPARLAIREQVKALELDAERRLIGALEALAPAAGPSGPAPGLWGPVADGLVEAARAWARVVPRAELVSLAARLSP